MNIQNKLTRFFTAALLAGAALVAAADDNTAAAPAPWRVPEAAVRVPVTISPESARLTLGRMPPDVYLSELKPIKADGLTFVPETTNSPKESPKGGNWKPELNGTATYALKPEYTHFTAWLAPDEHGGIPAGLSVSFDGGKTFAVMKHRGSPSCAGVHPIPPGAETITLKYSIRGAPITMHYKQEPIRQAGFIARRPSAASVAFQLPDLDPSRLVPLVYTADGKRVGCRVQWARLGERMALQFDYAGEAGDYYVYLVERSKHPAPLAWEPKMPGLVMESRLAKTYDSAIQTVAGFRKLWAEADDVLGRKEVFSIHRGWFPFRPTTGTVPRYRLRPKHLALTAFSGTFHVPYTGRYEFLYSAREAAYFLVDDKLVSGMDYGEALELGRQAVGLPDVQRMWIGDQAVPGGYRAFGVELEKGAHRLDFLVYGPTSPFKAVLHMRQPGKSEFRLMGVSSQHGGFCAWEPIATARAGAIERRGQDLSASFSWSRKNTYLASYPGLDAYNLFFTAHLTRTVEGAVYRWRFSDGSVREGGRESPSFPAGQITGKVVYHIFLSPGLKTVQLEALDGPDGKVIARTSGKVHVQARWEGVSSRHWLPFPHLAARAPEFEKSLPIEELASTVHRAWFRQDDEAWVQLYYTLVDAMARRVDELIEHFPYSRLLDWGTDLASPALAKYDAAERLLEAVMARAPAGGYHWTLAATELARFRAHSRPEQALDMVRLLKETAPAVDPREGWTMADAGKWHFLPPDGTPLPDAWLKGLAWSEIAFPVSRAMNGAAGLWLNKEFTLPASRKGKELVIEFGDLDRLKNTWSGAIWCNGKWVGHLMEEWPDGRVIVPPGVQNAGGRNRLTLLFQNVMLPPMRQRGRTFQIRGPQKVNRENMQVPMPLYLTEACEQIGVNVAYYEGTNGKLPDLAKAEPVDTATQARIDLSLRERDENFGMIFTGYLQVAVEGEYPFEWRADAHTTVTVDGKEVGNRQKVFLTAGAHPVTVIYHQQGRSGNPTLELTLPYKVVAGSEVAATRIEADALLALGMREEAVKILTELNPFAWPLPQEEQVYVEQARMRIRRLARSGRLEGRHALPIIDSWLFSHPLLRLDPEFMVSVIEAYANIGDRTRAFLLAEQMLKEEMNDGQRRNLILTQVKAKLNDGDLEAAGEVYRKLKALAPQSEELIEARELIKAALIKRR